MSAVPTLTISLGIEGTPRVAIHAETYEDERRAYLFLTRPGVVARIVRELERVVREVEEDA